MDLVLGEALMGYYILVGVKYVFIAYAAYKTIKAVRNVIGNITLRKKIKEKKFDATHVDENGRTPLMKAYTSAQTEMMIKEGLDVNAKDKFGMTPLMYAAKRGDAKSVQLLLNAGAKIDDVNNNGNSALMYAAISGNKKTLELLTNSGANTNIINNEGETALMFLAEREYFWSNAKYNRISYLMAAGADCSIKDKSGRTALDRHIENEQSKPGDARDYDVAKLLSRKPEDAKRDNVKKTMSLQGKKSQHRLDNIEKAENGAEMQQDKGSKIRPRQRKNER